jgi:sugar lactone lactonase YvrE
MFVLVICAVFNATAIGADTLFVGFYGSGGGILDITSGGGSTLIAGGFESPAGLAFDASGNLYASDAQYPNFGAGAIYKITPNGTISTFASGINPYGLAFDTSGNLYAGDAFTNEIYKFTPSGVKTIFATGVYALMLAFDKNGNLFVADPLPNGSSGPGVIDEFSPSGARSTFASGLDYPLGLAFDSTGDLFVSSQDGGGTIYKFDPSGASTIFAAGLGLGMYAIAFDSSNTLFATDQHADVVYQFDSNGSATTVVSLGGSEHPEALVFQPSQSSLYNVCLLYDRTKVVKSGSTIPIKLQLCDSSGNDLSSSSITVHGVSITQVSTSITGTVQDSGNANPDNDFRFDITLGPTGGYIFNLSTNGLTTGTYNLNFTAGSDPVSHAAPFQVK